MPLLKHLDNLGTARFLTFSCYNRQKLLVHRNTIIKVLNEIETGRSQYGYSVLAYVIMPSHVHLVIHPKNDISLGRVIGNIKRKSSFAILSDWKRNNNKLLPYVIDKSERDQKYKFWQKRCYDHNCRTGGIVKEKIIYCHYNPVRAGLIRNPEEWEWSSYRWYLGDKSGIVQISEDIL